LCVVRARSTRTRAEACTKRRLAEKGGEKETHHRRIEEKNNKTREENRSLWIFHAVMRNACNLGGEREEVCGCDGWKEGRKRVVKSRKKATKKKPSAGSFTGKHLRKNALGLEGKKERTRGTGEETQTQGGPGRKFGLVFRVVGKRDKPSGVTFRLPGTFSLH